MMAKGAEGPYTYDNEGCRHAPWCADPKGIETDAGCDCSPCNVCEGAGCYGDEDGNTMDCMECGNDPDRTHFRPKRKASR